jgi:ParB family transcriptional regulator, chromosome partitioning protein
VLKGKKSLGLGRGFDSLIPTEVDTSLFESDSLRVEMLPVDKLEPNPEQPRARFDEEELAKLSSSVKQHGILQPLLVTPHKKSYLIVAGERRWRAAKLAGLTEVPALVRTSKELERLEIGLIENVQRVDLSPIEQALSIAKLHDQFNMSIDVIAERIGKASSTVHNLVRLLQLPDDARKALEDGQIHEGHARSILALKGEPELQTQLLQAIISQGWSVRQAEQFVVAVKAGAQTAKKATTRTKEENAFTKGLTKAIGMPVSVQYMAQGGRMVIRFRSEQEYQKLQDYLGRLE